MKLLLASLIAVTPISAIADEYQRGYASSKICYRSEYREEYVPGTAANPGYVKSWHDTIEYPCAGTTRVIQQDDDGNDCTDGKVAGAILGGGAAAAMSRGDGRWWAIPIGAVVGSKIGCDAAGG